jgi:hypothetical protein
MLLRRMPGSTLGSAQPKLLLRVHIMSFGPFVEAGGLPSMARVADTPSGLHRVRLQSCAALNGRVIK